MRRRRRHRLHGEEVGICTGRGTQLFMCLDTGICIDFFCVGVGIGVDLSIGVDIGVALASA